MTISNDPMTQSPEIRIFEGLEPLSWAAATRLEEQARVKAIEKKPLSVALSGVPRPSCFLSSSPAPTFQGRVRWANLQLFQVDERCVPPDDPQSNYRMIRQALLESVPLPAGELPPHGGRAPGPRTGGARV